MAGNGRWTNWPSPVPTTASTAVAGTLWSWIAYRPTPTEAGILAHLNEAQFDWLTADLAATPANVPVLIVSHVPILAACIFFDGKRYEGQTWNVPGRWMHADARRLVDLFDKHRNVKAYLSGHIHLTDRVDYNGVSYYRNGAMSGAWWFGAYQHTADGMPWLTSTMTAPCRTST